MEPCPLSALAILCILASSSLTAAPGDWPMMRRDARFTGRSPMKGSIRRPAILGSLPAGTYEGLAAVRSGAGSNSFSAPRDPGLAPDYMAQHKAEWDSDGLMGKGANRPDGELERAQVRWVKLLPDVPGLQKVEFEDSFSGEGPKIGRLYAYDQGPDKPRVVWKTEPEECMYTPTLLIVDADADGLLEVVVATHYRVMIYNGQTGVKKTELRWHDMRNYGFFGCFTVPGEKYPKFVVIADFVSHIDVLDNDGKNLKVLWRKDIEPTILRKQKVTRPGPNPIADIDGDGRIEITLNIYNDSGDKLWHVISYDALTGSVRFDMKGSYLNGLADVDGDGIPELFLQETRGLAVPTFAPIRLASVKGGREKALWRHKKANWQTTSLTHVPLTTNTAATDGSRTVLLGSGKQGVECYAVAPVDGAKEALMVVARGPKGRWESIAELTGPAGARLAAKAVGGADRDGLLFSWRTVDSDSREFRAKGLSGEVVSLQRRAGPPAVPIVARLRQSEPPTVLFDSGNDETVAYQRIAGEWRLRWKAAGHGVTVGAPTYQGAVAADIDSDGEVEVLVGRTAPSGEAEIAALNPDGKAKWTRVFAGFDGAPPIWNRGGITLWNVGNFTSASHKGVFVTLRRSTMHSDEGFLLSGKDGKVIWHQDAVVLKGEEEKNWRGYAGHPTASADVDGDGLDELVCCFPDRYWIASGKTGEMKMAVGTEGAVFPGMWVAYGIAVVADFLGTGKLQVLYGGSSYLTALLGTDGKPLWFTKYLDGPQALQGFGDVEGKGKLMIGGAGYNDGFRCYDPADGTVKWTYALPKGATSGPTITADVDGDGIDEFLFTHGKTLYALSGKDGKPNVVWSLELVANPGPLAYADGDGKAEILVGGNDGKVYVVGERL